MARYARREKSVDPAGDTRRAYGSVEGRGEHGGRVRSVLRVAAKRSDSCLSPGIRRLETHVEDARGATGGAVPVGRRRRRARFGDAKQCSDRAGHQVRAPQAIGVDRYRSRGIGSRSTCRVEKRARSLARSPGRADPSPPPVPSRRLSSRTTPSRDARADLARIAETAVGPSLARRARELGSSRRPRRGSFFPVGARDEPVTAGAAAREPEAVGRRRRGCGVPRARVRDGGGARRAEARLECLLVPRVQRGVGGGGSVCEGLRAPARGAAAWRALPRLPRLRAPSQLFVLAHRAREPPRSPRGSPTSRARSCSFWWAAQTSRRRRRQCGAHVAAAGADARVVGVVVAGRSLGARPHQRPDRNVGGRQPAGARAFVERALTVLRALHLSVLFAPVLLLAPALLYADGLGPSGAELWYRMLRKTLELAAPRSSSGASGRALGTTCSRRSCAGSWRSCRRARPSTPGNAPRKSWSARTGPSSWAPSSRGWTRALSRGSIAQIHRARLREGVAESNGAGPYLGIQRRLLRAANAGVELAASGEWRRVLVGALEEWRQSAGKWEWNPGSFVGSAGGNGTETANGDASDSVARDERRESGVTAERADSFFPEKLHPKSGRATRRRRRRRRSTSTSTHPLGTTRGRLDGGPVRRREGASPGRGRGAPARLRHLGVAGERHQGRRRSCSRFSSSTPCSSSARTCFSRLT